MQFVLDSLKIHYLGGAWLAHSVEHETLDLGVVSLMSMLGIEVALKL